MAKNKSNTKNTGKKIVKPNKTARSAKSEFINEIKTLGLGDVTPVPSSIADENLTDVALNNDDKVEISDENEEKTEDAVIVTDTLKEDDTVQEESHNEQEEDTKVEDAVIDKQTEEDAVIEDENVIVNSVKKNKPNNRRTTSKEAYGYHWMGLIYGDE